MEQGNSATFNSHAAPALDATERLKVLCFRERVFYATSDYLTRMQSVEKQMPKKATKPTNLAKAGDLPVDTACPEQTKKRKSRFAVEQQEGNIADCLDSPSAAKRHKEQATNDKSDRTSLSSKMLINKSWREKICEWAFKVVDHFDLRREVVSVMMSHLDRYLSVYPTTVDKQLFQLLSMTCLYMAIKLNEYHHILLPHCKSSMESIIQLSRGSFTVEDMTRMERDILQRLQWRVHPPTPQVFLQLFLYCMPIEIKQDTKIHDTAQFLVELAAMDYYFVPYKASEIALAAMFGALDEVSDNNRQQYMVQFLARFSESANVLECKGRLELVYCETKRPKASTQDLCTNLNATRAKSPVSVLDIPQRNACP